MQYVDLMHLIQAHGDTVGDEQYGLCFLFVFRVISKVEVGVCRAFAFDELHEFEGVAVCLGVNDTIFAL